MRFDMHCHTKNGSLDGKINIEDYIRILRRKGFQGMLVTDHNSYNGYRSWKKLHSQTHQYDDFVVLKGIEYDTIDAGHVLVIMPDGIKLRLLEVRGMPVQLLVHVVHRYGGILGPAHPYGAKFVSTMRSKKMERTKDLIEKFDFVEAFNTCELPESNAKARELAQRFHKPGFGGSDSHVEKYVGTAYTDIDYDIRNCNDLIYAVKNGYVVGCGGKEREPVRQGVLWHFVPMGTAWKAYNKGLAVLKSHNRRVKIQEMFQLEKRKLAKKMIRSHR
ncbi:MAG: CehA/McbA family metallohydrolase [Lachnospiraceae bacterium]|nr:PHP domain-containing protein [Lachnospiraceae bacterium]MDD6619188.1 PHP domain-containing protein [Clostridiales bacterium]MDY4769592.1 PHP domain-containing protein [Lachnospiraceae bacterium]